MTTWECLDGQLRPPADEFFGPTARGHERGPLFALSLVRAVIVFGPGPCRVPAASQCPPCSWEIRRLQEEIHLAGGAPVIRAGKPVPRLPRARVRKLGSTGPALDCTQLVQHHARRSARPLIVLLDLTARHSTKVRENTALHINSGLQAFGRLQYTMRACTPLLPTAPPDARRFLVKQLERLGAHFSGVQSYRKSNRAVKGRRVPLDSRFHRGDRAADRERGFYLKASDVAISKKAPRRGVHTGLVNVRSARRDHCAQGLVPRKQLSQLLAGHHVHLAAAYPQLSHALASSQSQRCLHGVPKVPVVVIQRDAAD
ncbi:hypothetical protein HPB48_013759 [Haemaphysalis longicornis]|uniref:Uncharacterized protein n=1 Tax=Haemaphysalis longicornis TaxID=44386 RepID=A0A9J6FMF0_HAELO|nr:hypothetical protein HPB48_013759 [Haemaphysalis longicornis]